MIGLQHCGGDYYLCDACEGVIQDGEPLVKALMMIAGREKAVQATMDNFHPGCFRRLVDLVEIR